MEEKRTVGYICPQCGKAVIAERSTFALTAGRVSAACECGQSALEMETDGRRFRLWVPCGLCGQTHQAECTAEQILKGTGIGLACSQQGQLCCYIGEKYRVEKAMEDLQRMADKVRSAAESGEEPELFLDSVIMEEILSELKEIASRPRGITCTCGSSSYKISVRHAAVDLICGDCGARLRIPAATDEDLDELCCHMTLQIKGEKT